MPSADVPFDVGLLSPATAARDSVVSDAAVLAALVDVEVAYLQSLVAAGIAPATAAAALESLGTVSDPADLAVRSRSGGNPVIPLIADLRDAVDADSAKWVHRGATSQDILDSALMLVASRARSQALADLDRSVAALAALAGEHRFTIAAARTLTQHSTPTTWGLRFATWLTALLDARDALADVVLPAQLAGASGSLASFVAIAGADRAAALPADFAARLGLAAPRAPWHVTRSAVTRLGDALVGVTDAFGMIGGNVATLSRTEIGEVHESGDEGRGGSSAMPQKRNPVSSVLLRSLSMRAPGLAATLHVAAAASVDERPDGAWHAEWSALRELLRLVVGGAIELEILTTGLTVDVGSAARNLALTGDDILAERVALLGEPGDAADYTGLSSSLIDAAIRRARA